MAPESFNASLPERDIIIIAFVCVFYVYKSEECHNADTYGAYSFLPFFHFFS